ncbi:MAG: DUF4345 family protein, partial [Pseudomonadota bacterium]
AEPVIFLASSEVIVEHEAGLMSEVTAPSGLLVFTGLFMMLGSILMSLARIGLALGTLVYGSYGLSRMISMAFHGTPSDTLVVVAYFELGVAALLMALCLADNSSEASFDDGCLAQAH